MVPRIFISSTYYDLKHVRERLEKFIENYGFEPVLFESDKVFYQHGKPIDQSAYYEVGLCHIMILIIGGRYGSPSTQAKVEEERKRYDDEYISITRKEFDTAFQKNIPILVFIDKNVNSDYETYKENQDFFDNLYAQPSLKEIRKFKFAHVDHINVFKFVDLVKSKPVKAFERVEEIETYLKSQLSGMFYLYLESLKKKSDDNKILDTISELNNVTLRMNEMLSSVGKEILGKEKGSYEKVIESQLTIMLDFYVEKFIESLSFQYYLPPRDIKIIDAKKLAQIIYDNMLKIKIPTPDGSPFSSVYFKSRAEFDKNTLKATQNEISKLYPKVIIESFDFRRLNADLGNKVLPFIKTKADEERLIQKLSEAITDKLSELPF